MVGRCLPLLTPVLRCPCLHDPSPSPLTPSRLCQCQAMVDEFDRDQDGAINEQGFLFLLKSATL